MCLQPDQPRRALDLAALAVQVVEQDRLADLLGQAEVEPEAAPATGQVDLAEQPAGRVDARAPLRDAGGQERLRDAHHVEDLQRPRVDDGRAIPGQRLGQRLDQPAGHAAAPQLGREQQAGRPGADGEDGDLSSGGHWEPIHRTSRRVTLRCVAPARGNAGEGPARLWMTTPSTARPRRRRPGRCRAPSTRESRGPCAPRRRVRQRSRTGVAERERNSDAGQRESPVESIVPFLFADGVPVDGRPLGRDATSPRRGVYGMNVMVSSVNFELRPRDVLVMTPRAPAYLPVPPVIEMSVVSVSPFCPT